MTKEFSSLCLKRVHEICDITTDHLLYLAREGKIDLLTPIPTSQEVWIVDNSTPRKCRLANPVLSPNLLAIPTSKLSSLISSGATRVDLFEHGYIYYDGGMAGAREAILPKDCAIDPKKYFAKEEYRPYASKKNVNWKYFELREANSLSTELDISLSDIVIDVRFLAAAFHHDKSDILHFGQLDISDESLMGLTGFARTKILEQYFNKTRFSYRYSKDVHNKFISTIKGDSYRRQIEVASEIRKVVHDKRRDVVLEIVKEKYGQESTTRPSLSFESVSRHILKDYCLRFGRDDVDISSLVQKKGATIIPPKDVNKLPENIKESIRYSLGRLMRDDQEIRKIIKGEDTA